MTKRQAAAARQEVIAALGTDAGYAGLMTPTNIPCPRCAAEGKTLSGGRGKMLNRRADDGALWCTVHETSL